MQHVSLIGVVPETMPMEQIHWLICWKKRISSGHIVNTLLRLDNIPTTTKTRVIAGTSAPVLRVDDEKYLDQSEKAYNSRPHFAHHIDKSAMMQGIEPEAIILQDYNKGVLVS